MASFFDAKASLGDTKRILAVLFVVGFVVGFLLTPLGFETREKDTDPLVRSIFCYSGVLLPIAGRVSLWRRPRVAGVLAVIDAAFIFLTAPADQAKFFFTVAPPPAVTAGEFILILLGIGYMLYGQRIYIENR